MHGNSGGSFDTSFAVATTKTRFPFSCIQLRNEPNTRDEVPPPADNPTEGGNRHAAPNPSNWQRGPAWKCSDKQRDLILKLVDEHHLDKAGVEALAVERFGKPVMDMLEATAKTAAALHFWAVCFADFTPPEIPFFC